MLCLKHGNGVAPKNGVISLPKHLNVDAIVRFLFAQSKARAITFCLPFQPSVLCSALPTASHWP